jgi:hypothetical protein
MESECPKPTEFELHRSTGEVTYVEGAAAFSCEDESASFNVNCIDHIWDSDVLGCSGGSEIPKAHCFVVRTRSDRPLVYFAQRADLMGVGLVQS